MDLNMSKYKRIFHIFRSLYGNILEIFIPKQINPKLNYVIQSDKEAINPFINLFILQQEFNEVKVVWVSR